MLIIFEPIFHGLKAFIGRRRYDSLQMLHLVVFYRGGTHVISPHASRGTRPGNAGSPVGLGDATSRNSADWAGKRVTCWMPRAGF